MPKKRQRNVDLFQNLKQVRLKLDSNSKTPYDSVRKLSKTSGSSKKEVEKFSQTKTS